MSWQWKDKTWFDYDGESAPKIEAAHLAFKRGEGPATFSLSNSLSKDTYVIDFNTNKQINKRTHFTRPIRRSNQTKIHTNMGTSSEGHSRKVRAVPTGIKAITSLLLPKSVWHLNDIANLRLTGTDGLPPKTVAPHITLLDSFSSNDRFEKVAVLFKEAVSNIEPFEITIKQFRYFTHSSERGYTLYLEPEIFYHDKNPLLELQRLLYEQVNNSGLEWLEHKMTPRKFTPHVSLGKVSTKVKLDEVLQKYQPTWETITFRVTEIYILSKLVHDTVIRHVIPLGKFQSHPPQFDIVPFPNGTYSVNVNWVPAGSNSDDLRDVFKAYKAVSALVVFKTIDAKDFTKGWGNVVFSCRNDRDKVLGNRFFLFSKELEIFPCD